MSADGVVLMATSQERLKMIGAYELHSKEYEYKLPSSKCEDLFQQISGIMPNDVRGVIFQVKKKQVCFSTSVATRGVHPYGGRRILTTFYDLK